MLPLSLKESRQANSLHVPQRGPYGEKYPFTGYFYLSLHTSHFIFPSESPVRKPPPCSQTGSPWAAILHHQSHWSTFHSFIHSFIHVWLPESPKRSPPTYIWGETWGHRPGSSTQTEGLHTLGCSLFHQGDRYDTAISTPVIAQVQNRCANCKLVTFG